MGQIPFFRFLFPVISGVLFCKFISSSSAYLFIVGIIGLGISAISFFIPHKYSFSLRWLFGAGLMLFLFSITTQFYQYRLTQATYDFPQKESLFIGEVLDLPLQKKRSIACEVHLSYPTDKKVMIYFEPDTNSSSLEPGDQIVLHAYVKPFKNLNNPNGFDYEGFMQNKGFSGSAYVSSNKWNATNMQSSSIKAKALRVRAKVLELYKTFGLDDDAYSFISALTLGYKADLSDNLKESFRASGTSHILAVSGMHVGIVYIIILSLFSFLGKRGKSFYLKQVLVLICLWGYVFITGMPVSVVRAAVMLSLFCVGNIFNKKGLTYNTLAVAAFVALVINPFYLFDVGFQLSFVSVLSILFFQPKLSKLYTFKYKGAKYFWNLFTISLSAQLGVFPLVLYYFGTFPTYFFIANLLVLPFIGAIIYLVVLLIFFTSLPFYNLVFIQWVVAILFATMQFLIKAVLQTVSFFESLPMSVLEGYHITTLQLFLIFAIILSFSLFMVQKEAKLLISLLLSITILIASISFAYIKKPIDRFVVYNSYNELNMGYIINGEEIKLPLYSNQVVSHPSASVVLLTENLYASKRSDSRVSVDYLILASDNSFSIVELVDFFQPKKVIIDSSIARYAVEKIKSECQRLNLSFHDISNLGAFSINF